MNASNKQIEKGNFSELPENVCRVLFMRHAAHKNNIIPEKARRMLRKLGRTLKDAGLKISAAISSPEDRALYSIIDIKVAMQCGGTTITDMRLGALAGENPDLIKLIMNTAKKMNTSPEKAIFRLCVNDEEMLSTMIRRGREGAEAIRELAQANLGKTVIAGSHGGSRIELSVLGLLNQLKNGEVPVPEHMFNTGEVVELLINNDGEITEVNYLEMA